jgi:lipopolysaccharide transport system permease protein
MLLVRRDVAVRYRQTAVGALWAALQPLALATVLSVFLGGLAKVPSQGTIPYPLYVFAGMVMWLYFSQALTRSSESTVAAGNLIAKVYFPRLLIPIVAALAPAVDFAVASCVLFVVMFGYGYFPGPEVLLLPFAAALALATALGAGMWLSALHVRYRDVQHVVPFLILVGLFVTPVTYPFSLVPHALQPLYALNPMVGVLEVYRWTLFGQMSVSGWLVLIPVCVSAILLVTGTLYFKRVEHAFADLI